jgi:hypothetical protein
LSIVLSGPPNALRLVCTELEDINRAAWRPLPVNHLIQIVGRHLQSTSMFLN